VEGYLVRRLRLDLEEWVGVLHGCGVWGICLREVGVDGDESELSASPCVIRITCYGLRWLEAAGLSCAERLLYWFQIILGTKYSSFLFSSFS
jgi:hypothetical protein